VSARPTADRATPRRHLRLAALVAVALLPPALKPACYRALFGYRIGRRFRIGLSILDAGQCDIGDDVAIGHGNAVLGVRKLSVGDHVRVGHLNVIRGGAEVRLGRYAHILRLNEINSIPDPVVVNATDPRFLLGAGSVVTAGHKLDFTDRVEIGRRVILGGRNSSIWTHNRQRTAPVRIGAMTYVGSETRFAPGAVVGQGCIVGMGAVVVDELAGSGNLVAGVPARVVKPLGEDERFLVERPTRDDLPDDL
jgi:acetyltransferase-like isoleucine patch superfamily enzyme